MREIGPPRPVRDPGEVYYVIRESDVGKTAIQTEIGPVDVSSVLGRVLKNDIGKRLYRVNLGDSGYIWQAENNRQYRERTDSTLRNNGD